MLSNLRIVWTLLLCTIARYHSWRDVIHISFPWYAAKVCRSRDGVRGYGVTHALVTALGGWRGGRRFNWILSSSWQQSRVLVLANLFTKICFPWSTHDSSPWSNKTKHIHMMHNSFNRARYWHRFHKTIRFWFRFSSFWFNLISTSLYICIRNSTCTFFLRKKICCKLFREPFILYLG